jgi:hypothetical protein
MKVVHITKTPLAGSPIRISDCLNKYSKIESRVINLNPNHYGKRSFKEDLSWFDDKGKAISLIKEADILHFHHYFDYASDENAFGFNFVKSIKKDAKIIMHWHSNPNSIIEFSYNKYTLDDLNNIEYNQMVVAQFHESYYPNAMPVPLIVDTNINCEHVQNEKPLIFYSPSNSRPSFWERWETKGKPETLRILKKLKRKGLANYMLVENVPFEECMNLRAKADIVIDDLVTGSFHTTSLEALAMGKVTVSYIDSRTQLVLSELVKTSDIPIVNVSIENAYKVLENLCKNKRVRESISKFSRDWLKKYYNEEVMIKHYISAYEDIVKKSVVKNPRYINHREAKLWLYKDVPDLIWKSRKKIGFFEWFYIFKDRKFIKKILFNIPFIGDYIKRSKNV